MRNVVALSLYAIFALSALAVTSPAYAELATATSSAIFNFHEVAPGIYRGARPGQAGMQELAELGVRTDLDLENETGQIRSEQALAQVLGIRVVSLPMSGFFAPSDRTVDQALSLLADPANYPIYVHCHHGQDRTGLIVGLFRVLDQGWRPADAYREMRKLGFHRSLFPLHHYFEKRTGYDD